jgi:hypothetical protein
MTRAIQRLILVLGLLSLGVSAAPWLGEPPRLPALWEDPGFDEPTLEGLNDGWVVDTNDREAVRSFFNTVYASSSGVDLQWSGDRANCAPGSTALAARDAVRRRINFFRAMAGLPATITLNATYNAKDQAAALMMSAQGNLSHTPPASWTCYSADGAEAAGKSNLALGVAGPEAIDGYIEDYGSNNQVVGHRRWLLYPQTLSMGTGDVERDSNHMAANAVWVFDGRFSAPRPTVRDGFVAWPPPGFAPYQVVYPRWSVSYPGATFTGATVTLEIDGTNAPVVLEPVTDGYGENTLVWHPAFLDPATPVTWPPLGDHDVPCKVTVEGVTVDGNPKSFNYTVTIFDPRKPSASSVVPAVSGPSTAPVGQPTRYGFPRVPGATAHEWQAAERVAYNRTEGAETQFTYITADTTPGYPVIQSTTKASGVRAFHLVHPEPEPQTLTFKAALLPVAASTLTFKSRLTYASTGQSARVQVSDDDGSNWADVFTQVGKDGPGENTFSSKSVPLGAFAGRQIRVRVVYRVESGASFYPQTNESGPAVGWFIDDLSFTSTEELTAPVSGLLAGDATGFDFNPTHAGEVALAVRAQVYDGYPLEWGPFLRVTAIPGAPLTIRAESSLTVASGQVTIEFATSGGPLPATFRVWSTEALPGGWSQETSAVLQTVTPGSRFRATLPQQPGTRRYYRVSN